MPLNTAKVSLTVSGNVVQATPNVLVPLAPSVNYSKAINLAAGFALNAADRIFVHQDTVSTGTPDTFDVSGALLDPVGDPFILAKMVGLVVWNNSINAGEILSIGGHASAAIINFVGASNDIIKVGPGGFFAVFDPSLAAYGITATTADILQIGVAAGTNVPYDLIIIGRSA